MTDRLGKLVRSFGRRSFLGGSAAVVVGIYVTWISRSPALLGAPDTPELPHKLFDDRGNTYHRADNLDAPPREHLLTVATLESPNTPLAG